MKVWHSNIISIRQRIVHVVDWIHLSPLKCVGGVYACHPQGKVECGQIVRILHRPQCRFHC